MQRDSGIIYRSFYEAGKALQKEQRAEYYDLIFQYMFYFEKGESDDKIVEAMFGLISPQIEANIKKYKAGSKQGSHGKKGGAHGKKGGRPKKETKKITPQETPLRGKTENPPSGDDKPPNNPPNVYDNVNVNLDVNVYVDSIFLKWNNDTNISSRKDTDLVNVVGPLMEKYPLENVLESISTYSEVIKSDKTYYTYKFTLKSFLSSEKGLEKFMGASIEDYMTFESKSKSKDLSKIKIKDPSEYEHGRSEYLHHLFYLKDPLYDKLTSGMEGLEDNKLEKQYRFLQRDHLDHNYPFKKRQHYIDLLKSQKKSDD